MKAIHPFFLSSSRASFLKTNKPSSSLLFINNIINNNKYNNNKHYHTINTFSQQSETTTIKKINFPTNLLSIDFIQYLPSQIVSNNKSLQLNDMMLINEENKKDFIKNHEESYYKLNVRKNAIQWRKMIKKKRRIEIGPFATMTFENYDINWIQCHEMVMIEKGGNEQFKEEIKAYNCLIPNGKNLITTFMFEIDSSEQIRKETLSKFGYIEKHFYFNVFSVKTRELIYSFNFIPATTIDNHTDNMDGNNTNKEIKEEERTSKREGGTMTSAVHFLKINFKKEEIDWMKRNVEDMKCSIHVEDDRYPYATVLSKELIKDLVNELD
ncbi:hypothetical protein ABK040_007299 [Willaertia magna]